MKTNITLDKSTMFNRTHTSLFMVDFPLSFVSFFFGWLYIIPWKSPGIVDYKFLPKFSSLFQKTMYLKRSRTESATKTSESATKTSESATKNRQL